MTPPFFLRCGDCLKIFDEPQVHAICFACREQKSEMDRYLSAQKKQPKIQRNCRKCGKKLKHGRYFNCKVCVKPDDDGIGVF